MERVFLSVILLLSYCGMAAQSLYEENMKLGEMFQRSGCYVKAEQYYLTAMSNSSETDRREWFDASLHLADLLKFSRPVEARRMLDDCERGCAADTLLRQKHLAVSAYIDFWLGNKHEFDRHNAEFMRLCQEHEQLTRKYDKTLQAMHEALEGYRAQAFRTLEAPTVDPLERYDIKIHILEAKGDHAGVVRELRHRAATVDSLYSLTFDTNLEEVEVTASMTSAQKKAEKRSSVMLLIVNSLVVVIFVMLIVWILLRRITQKKLTEKNSQLLTALKMANETDEMKSEFVRRVSHEIRTPLNAITGFNEVLNNMDIEVTHEEREDLTRRISENVKAITDIVDELLQVADAESTHDYSRSDTIYCNPFFSELLYRHSSEVGSDVELNYTTKVMNRFTIETNADALKKIVEHLIGNAIKFTRHGSIELSCWEEKKKMRLAVTDTGRGIPKDKQDEVFEQFAKADAFKQGIGLGLTVSRKMAQKLGGNLELDKSYTKGARFILTLPLR